MLELLTKRQRQFVIEYTMDPNATQSAIRAGYSPNGASVTACRLLKEPTIQAALREQMATLKASVGLTVAEWYQDCLKLRDESRAAGQYAAAAKAHDMLGHALGVYDQERRRDEQPSLAERMTAVQINVTLTNPEPATQPVPAQVEPVIDLIGSEFERPVLGPMGSKLTPALPDGTYRHKSTSLKGEG